MKIALAQIRSETGAIEANLTRHGAVVKLAAEAGATIILFPELSLSGYEPELAESLAIQPEDPRLEPLQFLSDQYGITLGIGAPIKLANGDGVAIGLIVLQVGQKSQLYYKTYLHPDEYPFFASEENHTLSFGSHTEIALSICFEISVPEHAHRADLEGARYYLASVAKFKTGIDRALERLAEIARRHRMEVLMVNAVGPADGVICVGKTSVWNEFGTLLGQLSETEEGILLYDTETQIVNEIEAIPEFRTAGHPEDTDTEVHLHEPKGHKSGSLT